VAESGSLMLGFALTLLLHASVLLGAVWLCERIGLLRHAARAELAWRAALFGALLSASLGTVVASWSSAAPDARAAPDASRSDAPPAVNAALPAAAVPPARSGLVERTSAAVAAPAPRAARGAADRNVADVRMPDGIVRVLTLLWLSVSLAMLVRVAGCGLAVHRLQRAARSWPDAPAAQRREGAWLASRFGLPAPRLRRAAQLESPVALPDGSVLLPDWSMTLPRGQSRALLAHEFAHQHRRDPLWRIAQQLALVPLSLHPLAWIAQRRLDALAERRADALAARVLGDGRALAECLALCLARQQLSSVPTPRFALAMAERPGAVVDRVQHLLEDDPMNDTVPSPRRTRLALALGLLACLSLPSIAVVALADGFGAGQSISIHSDADGNESVEISIANDGYRLEAEIEGRITYAPDESDVTALAADAELQIEETRDGVTRAIAFARSGDGVARDYRVDGEVHAFDAEGRAWLAQVLPELFRRSGIDAKARAQRLLARGGADALLAEIDLIHSDYGRGRYLGLLYTLSALDSAQQARALELMSAIQSDYELRQALAVALASNRLERAQQHQVLVLAQQLDSDYERAELLIDTAARFAFDQEAFEHWARALDGIGSDYERRRVLEALLAREDQYPGAVGLAFDAARDLGSDYEKRQLLEAGLQRARGNPALRAQYLEVAATIGSDYERKEALLALLRGGAVDAGLALATLEAISGIGSDHECKEALLALAARMPADAAVIEAYRAVARRLSTYERGEAEEALDRRVVTL
jgi:hypothetical protein